MYRYNHFIKFVMPSILAFALSGVYTIVDGFFVGQSLGDIGLASITLGYPIAAFIQAVGTGIGLSGAIHFTILHAQKRNHEQKACFGGTTLLMLLVSALITALLLLFLYPLLNAFGAEGDVLQLTADYIRVIALGAVFQLLATGFVPFIRNMGGATFAMVAMMIGFVANIILDYLFVWVYQLGMSGAAWATVIGQAMTMLAAIGYFRHQKTGFHLPAKQAIVGFFGKILKVSLAPFGLTFSPIITMILMNRFLLFYGTSQSIVGEIRF
ncbi:Na+-driven multidrug efflux pump [Pasteurella testudinis DSM 23072]|uniref:Na+-driven multidrug efflux pump n=1 Tax=Pasteurella testudinis DSM 23072 TaxID=1122938 RepID=A0A1W1V881_9PAST|nr:MATE family efflux transporter [Pasteurella testudinis]SMB89214.1 Na+-driven multidrug efflux pump [Pasteurella testudinis DSM 23072]SUB52966.1 Multidrug export protein mepA [Pasteurella testudinis]